jgi:hypothetical protein
MTLTPSGGKLEQDCGSFVLMQPIVPAKSGRFSAKGFFEKTIGPMRLTGMTDLIAHTYMY